MTDKKRLSVKAVALRKQAEQALELNSEIFKNVAEGIYLIGFDDGIIKYANPRFETMFGYAPGELIGKDVAIVNAPTEKSPEETKMEILRILKDVGEWHGEIKNIHKDGTHFWCYANVSVFAHPAFGQVIVSVHTDITKRKRAEEKIQQSERQLREAQVLGRIGNWEYDIRTGAIRWSDQVYSLYERDPALGPPTVEEEAAYYSPEMTSIIHEYARRAAEERNIFAYEFEANLPSGRTVHFSATMQPINNEYGQVVKLFGTVQDITAQKQAEAAHRKSESQLRYLSRKLIVAHEEERAGLARELHDELGQNLSALLVEIEWLKKQHEHKPEYFERISGTVEELSREVWRICKGLHPLVLNKLGLSAAIESLIEKFIRSEEINVESTIAPVGKNDLPQETALGIYRILQEALTNVARHSEAKNVSVSMTRGDDCFVLEVRDDGVGFPVEENLEIKGIGVIGMRERVTAMGGKLKVESAPGRGTFITLRVPIKKEESS